MTGRSAAGRRPDAKLLQDTLHNRKIHLTEKKAANLRHLYRADGKPVPGTVLLNEVWGYCSNGNTYTLETHIYRLRQNLSRRHQT